MWGCAPACQSTASAPRPACLSDAFPFVPPADAHDSRMDRAAKLATVLCCLFAGHGQRKPGTVATFSATIADAAAVTLKIRLVSLSISHNLPAPSLLPLPYTPFSTPIIISQSVVWQPRVPVALFAPPHLRRRSLRQRAASSTKPH